MSVTSKVDCQALINGEWVDGSAGTLDSTSPYSGEVVATLAKCDPSDVDTAARAARAAQPGWAATPLLDRVDLLYRAHAIASERAEDIAQAISLEMGKTIREAREEVEVFAVSHFRRAAEDVLRYRGAVLPSTQERTNDKRILVTRRPAGVVGLITPYNFPVDIGAITLTYAVASGNCVVWKPTEHASLGCLMFARVFENAGFPPGVVNVVTGEGDVGEAIVSHPEINVVSFTGSTHVGEAITRRAGLKRLLLELGGNGPLIVLPDADIERAVEASVLGCYYLAGQCCTAAERILVHDSVHDDFVQALNARMGQLQVGDPSDEATDMGPLATANTLRLVQGHVEEARRQGASVMQAGEGDGQLYPPTILTDVSPEMRVACEETFGPVAPVIRFRDVDEAIRLANDTPFGLNAAAFTNDLQLAWRFGERLEHGTVLINETTNYWDQLAAFGGSKQSGVGRTLSTWLLDSLTEAKTIIFDVGDGPR